MGTEVEQEGQGLVPSHSTKMADLSSAAAQLAKPSKGGPEQPPEQQAEGLLVKLCKGVLVQQLQDFVNGTALPQLEAATQGTVELEQLVGEVDEALMEEHACVQEEAEELQKTVDGLMRGLERVHRPQQ